MKNLTITAKVKNADGVTMREISGDIPFPESAKDIGTDNFSWANVEAALKGSSLVVQGQAFLREKASHGVTDSSKPKQTDAKIRELLATEFKFADGTRTRGDVVASQAKKAAKMSPEKRAELIKALEAMDS